MNTQEILRTIDFSWPLITVILFVVVAIIFRKKLGALIGEIKNKINEFDFNFERQPPKQHRQTFEKAAKQVADEEDRKGIEEVQNRAGNLFFSYARSDSEFVLKLAEDLRSNGINLWLDQLDIPGGARWDDAVEEALHAAPCLLVVLSPASVTSDNVKDEISFGLENHKTIVPILYRECTIPFRLKRLQYIDFRVGYDNGFKQLVRALRPLNQLSTQQPVIPTRESRRPPQTKPIGLKITKPKSGEAVGGRDFLVEGHFDKTPPSGTFRIFITNFDGTQIWPQKEVEFHPETHKWEAKATLLDDPPNEGYILIAKIGDMGKLMCDQYTKVGETRDVWIPLSEFTADTEIYHKIPVRNGWIRSSDR